MTFGKRTSDIDKTCLETEVNKLTDELQTKTERCDTLFEENEKHKLHIKCIEDELDELTKKDEKHSKLVSDLEFDVDNLRKTLNATQIEASDWLLKFTVTEKLYNHM